MDDKFGIAYTYNNIGYVYKSMGDFTKAIEYYTISLKLKEEIKDEWGVAYSFNNIGVIYSKKGDFNKAIEYFNKSLEIRRKITDKIGVATSLNNIAEAKLKLGKVKEAKTLAEQSLILVKEIGFPHEIKEVSSNLTNIYTKTANWKGAYEMQVLNKQMSDSIVNEKNQKLSIQKGFQYEYGKKAIADSIKLADERKITGAKLKQEKTQRFALYGGITLVALFSLFVFNRLRLTQKQNKLIENQKLELVMQKELVDESKKEILDSIHYAKRIQSAIITNTEFINEVLLSNFIFFKPKDIVSGDFYWATQKKIKDTKSGHEKHLTYIAVCDSTGHGVPGGFMSLLNIGFLSEALKEKNMEKPNEVFNYVRERLINSISTGGQKDGMDGILLCLETLIVEGNETSLTMSYAAANNEPILIRNGTIIELSKDKMPIGKGEKTDDFREFTHDIQKGDTIYLYTDGYADQFGGEAGKKFKYRPLNQLLLKISELPMVEQKKQVESTFINWAGKLDQVDDVLLMGIKFDS